jgi:hypothetical protein
VVEEGKSYGGQGLNRAQGAGLACSAEARGQAWALVEESRKKEGKRRKGKRKRKKRKRGKEKERKEEKKEKRI